MTESLRVLLADDHPIFRSGLRGVLEGAGHEVVAEAADGAEACQRLDELVAAGRSPNVVLMDLRMPGMDGVAATRQITETHRVPVLVLTTYDTDAAILRAIEAGATGYLLKDAPSTDLLAALRSAAAGNTTLAPQVASRLVDQMRKPPLEALTEREREVLTLVAQGLSNAEIGGRLFIAESTVKTHLMRVFGKLGVDDRTRAVTLAMERGMI